MKIKDINTRGGGGCGTLGESCCALNVLQVRREEALLERYFRLLCNSLSHLRSMDYGRININMVTYGIIKWRHVYGKK